MSLFKDFLIALTATQVPMPKRWTESLGLNIEGNAQKETGNGVISTNAGYQLFKTPLTRGAVDHRLISANEDEWFTYMLQLYLMAERDINKRNMLPYLNLIYRTTETKIGNTFLAPVVMGEYYTIYGDTVYPVKLEIFYSHTQQVVYSTYTNGLNSANPYVFDTNILIVNSALLEYLEMRVTTPARIKVSILNGAYPPIPNSILTPPNKLSPSKGYLKPQRVIVTGDGSIKSEILLIPSLSISRAQTADKLIPLLLGNSICDNMPPELLDDVKKVLNMSGDLKTSLPSTTAGIYDLDGNTDRRIL